MSNTISQVSSLEHDLYTKLGEQLIEVRSEAATVSGLESLQSSGQESLADLFNIGKEYFERISQAAYKVICDGSAEWKTIVDKSETALITAFTGILVAHLAIVAAVATAVATIIVKIFYDATSKELCTRWKASLPAVAS